ncbi:MAG: hydrogen gas-evolving membrane-bound hydrogenase subunit E [Candidatus Cryosericum sp.]
MTRSIFYSVFLGLIVAVVLVFLVAFPFGQNKMGVGQYYLDNSVKETGAENVVTAVTLQYRGFDTMGEVTVLFAAATGVSLLLYLTDDEKKRRRSSRVRPNFVVQVGSRIIFPFVVLFGVYIILHGHLTPGGGFQGGAIIASGVLMLYLANPEMHLARNNLLITEGLAGLTYVLLGAAGLFMPARSFLANFLPLGTPGLILSAGILLPLYIAVGVKVGSEFSGILDDLFQQTLEPGGEA